MWYSCVYIWHRKSLLLFLSTCIMYSTCISVSGHTHTIKGKGKVLCVLSLLQKGQLYTVIRPLRGYYDFTDSDRATTPGDYYTSSSLVKPWASGDHYLVGFGYCLSMFPLQGCVPLQAAILRSLKIAQNPLGECVDSPGFELAHLPLRRVALYIDRSRPPSGG